MAGRVRSEATIEPVMTAAVDTTGLRDGGLDRDLFGHRAEFRRIGSPSAAATRPSETCMRGGLWSPATISGRELAGRRCTAGRKVALYPVDTGEPEISMALELEVSMAGLTQFIGSR
jgi:hypothetical protein